MLRAIYLWWIRYVVCSRWLWRIKMVMWKFRRKRWMVVRMMRDGLLEYAIVRMNLRDATHAAVQLNAAQDKRAQGGNAFTRFLGMEGGTPGEWVPMDRDVFQEYNATMRMRMAEREADALLKKTDKERRQAERGFRPRRESDHVPFPVHLDTDIMNVAKATGVTTGFEHTCGRIDRAKTDCVACQQVDEQRGLVDEHLAADGTVVAVLPRRMTDAEQTYLRPSPPDDIAAEVAAVTDLTGIVDLSVEGIQKAAQEARAKMTPEELAEHNDFVAGVTRHMGPGHGDEIEEDVVPAADIVTEQPIELEPDLDASKATKRVRPKRQYGRPVQGADPQTKN